MASEIRVNKIENRSGLGTVTFADTGVDLAGIVTATTFSGSGASLTNIPDSALSAVTASKLTGALPAISGASLTGMASTDNVRTGILDVAGISTFRNDVNVGAAVTISESGIEASGIGITVANINGGQIGGRRNLIINGAMMVAQRGTSSTSTGYNTVDRFKGEFSGTDESPTFAQVDVSSGTTPYSLGFRKAYKVTNGNQTSGAGAADYVGVEQRIEAQNIATSGWNYTSPSSFVTFSFWVKSSVAQNFYGYLFTEDGAERLYSFETGSLTADTWTKITKTIPGNSIVQVNNDNGFGLQIQIWPFLGTNYTASGSTLNQWKVWDGAARFPDMTTTWYTTNDATWETTGWQLEVGSQATPFEHRSFGDELINCQRYFQVLGGSNGTYDTMSTGACASSTIAYVPHRLVTSMRATPSFTLLGAASDFMYTRDGGDHNPSAIVYDQAGKNMIAVKMTGTSLNQDDATRLFNINTNGGYLMDAEI